VGRVGVNLLPKCYEDPYKQDFTAKAASSSNGLLAIEPDYFFPGGGGQASDRGEIAWAGGKAKVIDVLEAGLKLEGEIPKVGEQLQCKIGWERRYPMMKAHTAEHMLFQSLSRLFPSISPEKVTIEPNSFSLFVRHPSPLDWEKVLVAEKLVNEKIREGKQVSASFSKKEDVGKDVRIKQERIEGPDVRVISIEDFDKVACSGLHVKNTGEISAFCIQRIASEKPGIWQIGYLIGSEAVDYLLESSKTALSSAQILGTGTDRLEKTVANMKDDELRAKAATKELAEMAFSSLEPEQHNGVSLYFRVFPAMEQKILQEWASKLVRKEKTFVIFAVKGAEKAFLTFGKSKDLATDVKKLANEAFRLMNGKGGGNEFFATGSGDSDKLDEAIALIKAAI